MVEQENECPSDEPLCPAVLVALRVVPDDSAVYLREFDRLAAFCTEPGSEEREPIELASAKTSPDRHGLVRCATEVVRHRRDEPLDPVEVVREQEECGVMKPL